MRKALVGACVLADYSVKAMRQRTRPALIFVVYHENGKKQIGNFREKLVIARKYCRNLSSIQVVTDDEFKEMRLR
ncbi:MAG: hypothetical protein HY652_09510 [Acidobacteria bacterium]|nr:hypothetical protein [Acidobacteriota bacterium]